MITENMVFKYVNEPQETIRIIYVSQEYSTVYFVSLYANTSVPRIKSIDEFEDEISVKKIIKVIDPYAFVVDENIISDMQKQERDYRWDIVYSYWSERKEELLNIKKRNKVFKEISEKYGIPLLKVQRLFTRFWQRGMNRNALLTDYKNSGGKGKDKNLGIDKIGRRKIKSNNDGVNVTEDIKNIFEVVIKKYYLKDKSIGIRETYNYMLRDFFSDKYKEDGEIKYNVWDKDRIPTYRQFYYWIKKLTDEQTVIIMRSSKKEFELKHRPLLSNSTLESNGPGVRFQVDATIADVYLVSSLSRDRIIGRPIVYAIIDVFSRVITGIYVGLEGPSWMGAMMALDNMVSNKVEFCTKYGIEITEEEWMANYIPDIIIADRGEFEGYSVENLINNLNIKIENTSPYRGDLKGIVERKFRTLNEKIKHTTPGAIQKEYRKRGDRDYRLDATLTLEEFTAMIIHLVIHHNNSEILSYPMEKEMIADSIKPIPMELWKWGIKNKRGRLRVIDREIFRLNVLPRGKASISRAGIKFKNLFYGSQKAMEEQWFINPKIKQVGIVYDPRDMNQIYIPLDDGNTFEKCYLLEPSLQYKDCILEEILFNQELLAEIKEDNVNNQNQRNVDLDKELDSIIKKAVKEKKKTPSTTKSNNEKLKGIRVNRAVEKEVQRIEESFELAKEEQFEDIKIINFNQVSTEEKETSSESSRLMDKLKKKRNEYREN